MHRIAPPPVEKLFADEVHYLRSVLRDWQAYKSMDDGSKRAFLWKLGTWQEYRDRVMFYRVPPKLDHDYKPAADNIDMIIADMLAECAGLEIVGRSVDQRLHEFERWIQKLDSAQQERTIWY